VGVSLLAEQSDMPSDILLQYGAIGAIAVVCLFATARLFTSLVAGHKSELERIDASHKATVHRAEAAHQAAIQRADAAYDREVARGDRLEAELRDLNKIINDKLAGELVRATDTLREVIETMRERRHL
jgi:predicted lipoprotein